MALTFDTSQAATKGFHNSVGHLEAMLQEIKEGQRDFVKMAAQIGDPVTDIVILWGAQITVDGQDFSITEGSAWYNGSRYSIDATAFTAPGGEVGVFVIDSTEVNLPYPVAAGEGKHREVAKLKFESGVADSAIKDHDQVLYVKDGAGLLGGAWTAFVPKSGAGPDFAIHQCLYRRVNAGLEIIMDWTWNAIEASGAQNFVINMPFNLSSQHWFVLHGANISDAQLGALTWSGVSWIWRDSAFGIPSFASLAGNRCVASGLIIG